MGRAPTPVWPLQHLLAPAPAVGREWLLGALWRAFLTALNDRQTIQWNEYFVDGSFAVAKEGALKSAQASAARA